MSDRPGMSWLWLVFDGGAVLLLLVELMLLRRSQRRDELARLAALKDGAASETATSPAPTDAESDRATGSRETP